MNGSFGNAFVAWNAVHCSAKSRFAAVAAAFAKDARSASREWRVTCSAHSSRRRDLEVDTVIPIAARSVSAFTARSYSSNISRAAAFAASSAMNARVSDSASDASDDSVAVAVSLGSTRTISLLAARTTAFLAEPARVA